MSVWRRFQRLGNVPRQRYSDEIILFADAAGALKTVDEDGTVAAVAGAGSLPNPTNDGDVLTVVSGSWAGAPGGGSQPLQRAYLRLTPTNIGQPSFTPFEIVPTPGANKMLVPVSVICHYVGGTTAYDGGSEDDVDVQIYYDDPVTTQGILFTSGPQGFWANTAPYAVLMSQISASTPVVDVANLSLSVALNVSGAPLATGNIPLDVWVWYIVRDLTDLT